MREKNRLFRRVMHLYKSGSFVVGLEHFLVMFPSALLIARLTNTKHGAVLELPTVLFACGIGTLVFLFLTRKKAIPFFLGPSFSYIGFVSYQVAQISNPTDVTEIRATILLGYIIASILLILLGLLYRYEKTKKVLNTFFPTTVMGPAISLIGLELAQMAATDSGFINGSGSAQLLALATLGCIIFFSLLRHHFLQNASILIGVIIGCVIATIIKYTSWQFQSNPFFQLPQFYISALGNLPLHNWISLTIAVIPCTVIAFIESLGRLSVYEGMCKREGIQIDKKIGNHAIGAHSIANMTTASTTMMPSAIYAENLAVMNLHGADLSTRSIISDEEDSFVVNCYSIFSVYPYIIASIISIFVALIGGLQALFTSIPMPILGGMELFVFALIAAPGIQLLVEQQVNYKKISNQITTASVLLAGISGISLSFGTLTLKGMSLGLTIGVVVNIISLILEKLGLLNERISIIELLDEIASVFDGNIILLMTNNAKEQIARIILNPSECHQYFRRKKFQSLTTQTEELQLQDEKTKKAVTLHDCQGHMSMTLSIPKREHNRLKNDHPHLNITRAGNESTVSINEYLSKRLLKDILESTKK